MNDATPHGSALRKITPNVEIEDIAIDHSFHRIEQTDPKTITSADYLRNDPITCASSLNTGVLLL